MPLPQPQSQSQSARIPQVDGPSDSSSDSSSPPPQQYAPHSSHPSLPQPTQSSTASVDDEAINSDLDDSDSEGEEDPDEGPGVSDIVFCTYDKVGSVVKRGEVLVLI
jgi:transcription initiation factor TFIIA large subunit